jgi:hypothetical protein
VAAQTVTLYTDSGLPETAELGEPFLRPRRLAECVAVMNDLAVRWGAVAVDEPLEREFEARLADSSTLAFRVAYSVLRHREDAKDVAQEAQLLAAFSPTGVDPQMLNYGAASSTEGAWPAGAVRPEPPFGKPVWEFMAKAIAVRR